MWACWSLGLELLGTPSEQLAAATQKVGLQAQYPAQLMLVKEPTELWQKLGFRSYRGWRLEDSRVRRAKDKEARDQLKQLSVEKTGLNNKPRLL